MAMLLSSVPGTSSHLFRGPVALKNGSFNETASIASTSGRLHYGAACLASSASCQMFGSSELVSWKFTSLASGKQAQRTTHTTVRVRSEGTTEGGNRKALDTWIGRLAMLGFVAAISVEISTGKGVLATAALPIPVPTPVLGLIALAGAVTAFGVFRSTDSD